MNIATQLPMINPDIKTAYQQIRNYLAGRFIGATRSETLLHEVIKCLFCRMAMEKSSTNTNLNDGVELSKVYRKTFNELKRKLPGIFSPDEEILLDPTSLLFVNQGLHSVNFKELTYDPFGDVYEVFAGNHIRGQEGQFFTPQNAVKVLVSLVDPKPNETVIDPACGSGGFLSATARHFAALGASAEQISQNIYGVDKDCYLAQLASARLSISTLLSANVYCADSLSWTTETGEAPIDDPIGKFDVVLTNPPFGSKIVAASPQVLRQFSLGHKWRQNRKTGEYVQTDLLPASVPPQVLFVERCLSLLRPGGRLGMVVPESLISSKTYRYVVQFIRFQAEIKAVIGMPEELFKTSGKSGTHTKTCLLFLEKKPVESQSNAIFMAEAKWCGRDSRGRVIERDELPEIVKKHELFIQGKINGYSHLGYQVETSAIVDNIFAPRYYNPEVDAELAALEATHDLVRIGELVESGLLELATGDEVGKLAYGSGSIPFVRTSDLSNWEIKIDPKQGVSEEIYLKLKEKQDVREGDILMVKDGTYLIGTCAFVTKYDVRIVYQSHLYKLRVTDPKKLSPYLLLAILSSAPVQRQIKAKRFTQDIIDSLGSRINELYLPIPKNPKLCEQVAQKVATAIKDRMEARELARQACIDVISGLESD